MSKTKIIDQFRQAVALIRDHLPAEDQHALQQAERAFGELRQHQSALQSRLEQVEAELKAARQEAQKATSEAAKAEVLAQQLLDKDAKMQQLQRSVADTKAVLVQQVNKGYNTEMIADFLDQLEMDLQCALYENEHETGLLHPHQERLRYFFECYGQFGGFVPMTCGQIQDDDSDRAREVKRQLDLDLRTENAVLYRAELEHLIALKARFVFALQCARQPSKQFTRIIAVNRDGSIEKKEQWEEVSKLRRKLK